MIGSIFAQAFRVLFYPRDGFKKEWSSQILAIYVFVLSLIPAIALFIELAMPATAGGAFLVNGKAILKPLLLIALLLLSFCLTAWLIRIFAKVMAGEKELSGSLRVVAFALTPFLLSYVFIGIPSTTVYHVISIFCVIYAAILLLVGVKEVLQPHGIFTFWLSMVALLFFLFFLLVDGFVLDKVIMPL